MTEPKDFIKQRANELTRAFFNSWTKGTTACQAMRNAAELPCSRFWISPECARKHIHRVNKHGARVIANNLLREMVEEIIKRCDGDYSWEKITEVVFSQAPKFYMRPETARKTIQQTLKQRKQCRNKK